MHSRAGPHALLGAVNNDEFIQALEGFIDNLY